MRSHEARLGVRLLNPTTRSAPRSAIWKTPWTTWPPRRTPSRLGAHQCFEVLHALPIRHVLLDFLQCYPHIHVEFVTDMWLIDIVGDGFDAGSRVLDDVSRDMNAHHVVQEACGNNQFVTIHARSSGAQESVSTKARIPGRSRILAAEEEV